MKERIAHICSLLPYAPVYADVGCDHGFMAEYLLRKKLCERIYITDIHEGSLRKAEILLRPYIEEGRCIPVLCDGLCGVKEECDFVLIAGMGGEETVKILSRDGIPKRFLLQPMKNTEKVRRFLIDGGAKIERDFTFSEEKTIRRYYDLILGHAEDLDHYSEKEFRFGRDNLNGGSPEPFLTQMKEELYKTEERLSLSLKKKSIIALQQRKKELQDIIDDVERTLQGN